MSKQEFLEELDQCLQGEVSQTEYQDSINYYISFIQDAMAQGQSEDSVISSLGSPRLIAKSIIEVSNSGNHRTHNRAQTIDDFSEANADMNHDKSFQAEFDGEKVRFRYGNLKSDTWYGKLILILIAIVLVVVVLSLLGVVATVVFRFIIPVVLVVWLIGFITKKFNRR